MQTHKYNNDLFQAPSPFVGFLYFLIVIDHYATEHVMPSLRLVWPLFLYFLLPRGRLYTTSSMNIFFVCPVGCNFVLLWAETEIIVSFVLQLFVFWRDTSQVLCYTGIPHISWHSVLYRAMAKMHLLNWHEMINRGQWGSYRALIRATLLKGLNCK